MVRRDMLDRTLNVCVLMTLVTVGATQTRENGLMVACAKPDPQICDRIRCLDRPGPGGGDTLCPHKCGLCTTTLSPTAAPTAAPTSATTPAGSGSGSGHGSGGRGAKTHAPHHATLAPTLAPSVPVKSTAAPTPEKTPAAPSSAAPTSTAPTSAPAQSTTTPPSATSSPTAVPTPVTTPPSASNHSASTVCSTAYPDGSGGFRQAYVVTHGSPSSAALCSLCSQCGGNVATPCTALLDTVCTSSTTSSKSCHKTKVTDSLQDGTVVGILVGSTLAIALTGFFLGAYATKRASINKAGNISRSANFLSSGTSDQLAFYDDEDDDLLGVL
eukprot:m.24041 g.24041  ORF g.24041 m.24041 type:complete len:328 (-) comp11133_c0_seq1:94-1077(-)